MANAKKLPSGAWRIIVFSHMEGGKRKYISFTAPTKTEAELKASEFSANKKRLTQGNPTVEEAVNEYINDKTAVLSPSTINGYIRMKGYYKTIAKKRVSTLTTVDMQKFISVLTSSGLSPKTVRNIYGLLISSVTYFQPDLTFKVSLPAKRKKRPVSPSDDVVRLLLSEAGPELRKCILLGIRGMRAGEISALRYEDISNGIAHIHADFVKAPGGSWVYKPLPKTEGSDRCIKVPDFGEGTGFIVKYKPATITKRFIDLRKQLGIEGIRFHDLRHYFASTAAVLNIPDVYTADMGGWSRAGNAPVMKSVYQNNITSMSDYYADKMENYLSSLEENAT